MITKPYMMKKRSLTICTMLAISCAVVLCVVVFFTHAETRLHVGDSLAATTSDKQISDAKVLVTYFTWPESDGADASSGASRIISDGQLYGNTEYVAHLISEATGGDLFAIKTERNYPSPHRALIDAAKKEAEAGERPVLTTRIKNLSDYDTVFVGFPNWWYDMPMAIYSFFDEYDFSGKTVIPFVTHGGSSFSKSIETIESLEKGAKVINGPSIQARNMENARQSIANWFESLKL